MDKRKFGTVCGKFAHEACRFDTRRLGGDVHFFDVYVCSGRGSGLNGRQPGWTEFDPGCVETLDLTGFNPISDKHILLSH